MNRLKGFIYDCIGWLAGLGHRKKTGAKKVLIIRVDEIGDYMLWHIFIKELANAERFQGYEFYFCGNQSSKSLFNTFDATWFRESYWMDKIRFKKKMLYRYRFLKNIYRQHFDVVINPTFSRDKRYDDSIVKAAKSPHTLGMHANLESTYDFDKGYDKDLYTDLFDHSPAPLFEFYRNQLFTEFVIQKKSQQVNTAVDHAALPAVPVSLPGRYFIVFPGSRSKKRIWPAAHFVLVSNYLFDTTGATAVLCGTKNDEAYINEFISRYQYPFVNLMGQTSLTEMLSLFAGADCLLSVDTGSVHLAAAVGCRVFGIFNGSQYKRFAPYPKELTDQFYAVYPDEIAGDLANETIVKQKYEFVVDVPYAWVKPEKVIHAIYEAG